MRLILILLLGAVVSCGPMNTPPKDGSNPGVNNITADGNLKSTKAGGFYPLIGLAGGTQRPILGENKYSLRFVCAQDLHQPSTDTKVTFSYWMPEMPSMGKFTETATLQPDGSYLTTLFFSMAGKWEITVRIEEKSGTDEYVFNASI